MVTKWQFEHSIVTTASRSVAWDFWSDVQNHAEMEGVAIELDGPFRTGTTGRTISADYRQEWTLSEVMPERRFVITGHDADFSLSFAWDFDDAGTGTRMTQQISANGPEDTMEKWAEMFRQMEINAPPGMDRLAEKLNRLGA